MAVAVPAVVPGAGAVEVVDPGFGFSEAALAVGEAVAAVVGSLVRVASQAHRADPAERAGPMSPAGHLTAHPMARFMMEEELAGIQLPGQRGRSVFLVILSRAKPDG